MWKVYAMHRRLPHTSDYRTLSTGRPALYLVLDDREQRADTARVSQSHRRSSLRLRRLPGSLSLEPIRPGKQRAQVPSTRAS